MTSARRLAPMPARPQLRHRGFDLTVHAGEEHFAFAVSHRGFQLHASSPEFRSARSADRAARRFIDDALGAFSLGRPPATA